MPNNGKFRKDLIMVITSNCIVLFGSILTGFIIPKLLGVMEYGYYKTFSLYLGYAPLLHFGFVDGIQLRYAGKEYEELKTDKFRRYTHFFLLFQIIISFLIILMAILLGTGKFRFLFVLLGINVFSANVTMYFQYVSQSTMRFKELSWRKILLTVSRIILILGLVVLSYLQVLTKITSEIYVVGLVLIDLFLTIWYAVTYREIIFGTVAKISECRRDILDFLKNGIVLTVSFETARIIFTLDRQFVSLLYDTSTYGIYSFAYNLVAMVTTIVGAVSLVLFPRLKQMDRESVVKTFPIGMAAISMVSFAALMGYQPLRVIIKWFLPNYAYALGYLRIIFPGLALSSCINVIMFTYYKALDAQKVYFKVCCVVLMISAALNMGAYLIFGTPEAISAVSIVSLLIWYLYCEIFFIRCHSVKWKKNLIYILACMSMFYVSSMVVQSQLAGWLLYSFFFIMVTVCFYKSELQTFSKRLFK